LTLQKSIGLADLTLENPLVSTPAAFRNYIILERTRELSTEGKRWFDLVRWGILKSTLTGLVKKIKDKDLETPTVEVPVLTEVKWDLFWNNRSLDWNEIIGGIRDFHILLPIPNNERLANPSIGENNPGYN